MGFEEVMGGYDTVCHLFNGNEMQCAREAIELLRETGTPQVRAAGKPEKEMPFYKGFSSTLTA